MSITYQIGRALRLLHGKFRPRTAAVILAGGMGTRMQEGGLTKQLMLLDGIPVIARSALAFEKSEYIDEIVVVTRKEEMRTVHAIMEEYRIKKLTRIVSGGETRQISARHGMEAVSDRMKYIAIHDAARCLITPAMIADVASAAYANRAAAAGCPVVDTVKVVDKNGYVTDTPDRQTLWNAQTPQIFHLGLYRAAAYSAKQKEIAATDDCALVEAVGQAVKMVDCGRENIKLTTTADLYIAEAILRKREEDSK